MRNKKSVKIIFLNFILPFLFSSGDVFAYEKSELQKLLKTKKCEKCDLSKANLSGSDLSGANLSGANLKFANLSGSDLSGANLSGSILQYAKLQKARLQKADLSDADLFKANLSGANLDGALLTRAHLSKTILPKLKKSKIRKDIDIIVLQLFYYRYIETKLCAESPRDFKYEGNDLRYINEDQLKFIKKATKIFDNYIKNKYPDVDTDEIWLKANQSWNKSATKQSLEYFDDEFAELLGQTCRGAAKDLIRIASVSNDEVLSIVKFWVNLSEIDNIPRTPSFIDKIDWDYKHVFKKWALELNKPKKEDLVKKDF